MEFVRHKTETLAVIEQYSDTLIKIALSYTRCLSTAEDIIQDTFLKYMQSSIIFENEEHKKAWLIRVITVQLTLNDGTVSERYITVHPNFGDISTDNGFSDLPELEMTLEN